MRPSRRQQAHWVLCRGRFKTVFLSPSPGSAWVRRSIWQEKSSLLILVSSSPPRQWQQLNRYGKLGSREVRAGRRCLQTAHVLTAKYKPVAGRGQMCWLGLKQILLPLPRDRAKKLQVPRRSAPRPRQRSQDSLCAQRDNLGCKLAIGSYLFYIFLDRSGVGESLGQEKFSFPSTLAW